MSPENAETAKVVFDQIEELGLTGKVILHCRDGRVEKYNTDQNHLPPWKQRKVDARSTE